MTKEQVISLTKYVQDLKDKLTSPTPEKHLKHPGEYRAYLNNEIRMTTKKLEAAKLEGVK